jgi:hypothetical protein
MQILHVPTSANDRTHRLTNLIQYLPEFHIEIGALLRELLHFSVDGIEPIDNRLEARLGFACEKRA